MKDSGIHSCVLKRARWVGIGLGVIFALLLVRIFWIQTVDYDRYQAKVIEQMTTESTVNAKRGNIYDRNGVLIATNISTYRVLYLLRPLPVNRKKRGKREIWWI